jgi:OmpA-OmpF porin, OOP family
MNTRQLAAAATLALAPFAAQAQMQMQGKAFVELGIGQASYDVDIADDSDTTFNISAGWMFHPSVGAEIGYRDLGKISEAGAGVEVSGFQLGAVGRFAVTPRISIVPRLGLYLWEADGTGTLIGASDDGNDLYFGVGADFAATPQLTVGLHFVRFDASDSDVDVFELRAGYRF